MKEINYTGPENGAIIALVGKLNESIRLGESTEEIVHQAVTDLYNLVGQSLNK
ncbi:hypothetical protein QN239_26770 [Mycolicibacterium sp. Y3]